LIATEFDGCIDGRTIVSVLFQSGEEKLFNTMQAVEMGGRATNLFDDLAMGCLPKEFGIHEPIKKTLDRCIKEMIGTPGK
jgi:hypothetical protein